MRRKVILSAVAVIGVAGAWFVACSHPSANPSINKLVRSIKDGDWVAYSEGAAAELLAQTESSRIDLRHFAEGVMETLHPAIASVESNEKDPNKLLNGTPAPHTLWDTRRRKRYDLRILRKAGDTILLDISLMRNSDDEWHYDGVDFLLRLSKKLCNDERHNALVLLKGLSRAQKTEIANRTTIIQATRLQAFLEGKLTWAQVRIARQY